MASVLSYFAGFCLVQVKFHQRMHSPGVVGQIQETNIFYLLQAVCILPTCTVTKVNIVNHFLCEVLILVCHLFLYSMKLVLRKFSAKQIHCSICSQCFKKLEKSFYFLSHWQNHTSKFWHPLEVKQFLAKDLQITNAILILYSAN